MIGFYDYTVILTYISLASSILGMISACYARIGWAIFFLGMSGLLDTFDGKVARTKKNRTEDQKRFGIQIDSLCDICLLYTSKIRMKKFVLKRTCIALLTVFLILLLLFLMLDFMPGSPFNNEEKMSAEQIADLYHKYGLDQPIINRFFLYLKNMLHGDFGISYSLQVNMKISEMIGPKIRCV